MTRDFIPDRLKKREAPRRAKARGESPEALYDQAYAVGAQINEKATSALESLQSLIELTGDQGNLSDDYDGSLGSSLIAELSDVMKECATLQKQMQKLFDRAVEMEEADHAANPEE